MTPTRWAISATTPRSWVMSSMAMRRRACSSRSTSSTWAWMVTSSAVVGSSAINSCGSPASAMAIMARCFMPPENWNGYSSRRRAGSGMPTARSSRSASSRALLPERPRWVASTSPICCATVSTGLRLVAGSWKIMAMSRPRTSRICASVSCSSSRSSSRTLPPATKPASGNRRISARAVMDLPQPDSPSSAKVSPACNATLRSSTAYSGPARWPVPR